MICIMGSWRYKKLEARVKGGRTHQSYTVGLLGPMAGSGPSEALGFRPSLLQPSALGVAAPNTPVVRRGINQMDALVLPAF